MSNKINIDDLPLVKKQNFKVFFPNEGYVHVTRTEVIRQLHHMGCTDGLPDDYEQITVVYKMYKEVESCLRSRVVRALQSKLKENEKNDE